MQGGHAAAIETHDALTLMQQSYLMQSYFLELYCLQGLGLRRLPRVRAPESCRLDVERRSGILFVVHTIPPAQTFAKTKASIRSHWDTPCRPLGATSYVVGITLWPCSHSCHVVQLCSLAPKLGLTSFQQASLQHLCSSCHHRVPQDQPAHRLVVRHRVWLGRDRPSGKSSGHQE